MTVDDAFLEDRLQRGTELKTRTTLQAGGKAEFFLEARSAGEIAGAFMWATARCVPFFILGSGSNVLISDDGIPGLVVHNLARSITTLGEGRVLCDTGALLQNVFLKTAQMSLAGFSFAVGIPGTVGGALVSNAGAYRNSISDFLHSLDVVTPDGRGHVNPAWMDFSYRDSKLRRQDGFPAVLLSAEFRLPHGHGNEIYARAQEYQKQRISKQPAMASAGSFFKNVNDRDLAARLPGLSDGMRESGVVPAGYLIEAAGLKGFQSRRAGFGKSHANFLLNLRGASAFELRSLAETAKLKVRTMFGIDLEEEVLYAGDWSRFLAGRD